MKLHPLVIFIHVALSVAIMFYINRFLEQKIRPRASLLRLFGYITSAFAIIFAYTFSLVWIIAHLFPIAK
jgi:hypothetical protein